MGDSFRITSNQDIQQLSDRTNQYGDCQYNLSAEKAFSLAT
ncbi:hypothetical protein [Coleofasciculus chthonoplastes]